MGKYVLRPCLLILLSLALLLGVHSIAYAQYPLRIAPALFRYEIINSQASAVKTLPGKTEAPECRAGENCELKIEAGCGSKPAHNHSGDPAGVSGSQPVVPIDGYPSSGGVSGGE
jgi:hypothetical protein